MNTKLDEQLEVGEKGIFFIKMVIYILNLRKIQFFLTNSVHGLFASTLGNHFNSINIHPSCLSRKKMLRGLNIMMSTKIISLL